LVEKLKVLLDDEVKATKGMKDLKDPVDLVIKPFNTNYDDAKKA